ncbi:MAG: DUF3090 family protein [Acidimicrobiia bacterium]|nr:DUF3090 family protein [Acidimicrobiia bacterium]
MSNSYELDDVDRFTAGTIGPRGQRVFYIQARGDGSVVSLRLEKQQVIALADYLAGVLDDLPTDIEPVPDADLELIEPVVAEWVVGNIGVAYAEVDDRIVLWTDELIEDDEQEPATARFRISRSRVAAFIDRARELVAAGRPPCPYCGRPLDGDGSWCSCFN